MAKFKYSKNDILNLTGVELNKLSKQDAIDYLKSANAYANLQVQNIKNYMRKSGFTPNIVSWQKESQTDYLSYDFKFNKNDTIGTIKKKLNTARKFLSAKTSKIKGEVNSFEAVLKDFAKRIGIDVKTLTSQNYKDLWELYNKIKSLDEVRSMYLSAGGYGSNQLQKQIYEIRENNPNLSNEDIISIFSNKVQNQYLNGDNKDEPKSIASTYYSTGKKD